MRAGNCRIQFSPRKNWDWKLIFQQHSIHSPLSGLSKLTNFYFQHSVANYSVITSEKLMNRIIKCHTLNTSFIFTPISTAIQNRFISLSSINNTEPQSNFNTKRKTFLRFTRKKLLSIVSQWPCGWTDYLISILWSGVFCHLFQKSRAKYIKKNTVAEWDSIEPALNVICEAAIRSKYNNTNIILYWKTQLCDVILRKPCAMVR